MTSLVFQSLPSTHPKPGSRNIHRREGNWAAGPGSPQQADGSSLGAAPGLDVLMGGTHSISLGAADLRVRARRSLGAQSRIASLNVCSDHLGLLLKCNRSGGSL